MAVFPKTSPIDAASFEAKKAPLNQTPSTIMKFNTRKMRSLSWMNDSGFWVVQRLSGFMEKETLKTWSVLLLAIALLGLVMTLLGSVVLPLK